MGERNFYQKMSHILEILSKIVIALILFNAFVAYLIRPLLVKTVHIIFDNDFIFKIYKLVKDTFSTLPRGIYEGMFKYIPEPHTNDWGSKLEHVTHDMGTTLMFKLITILIVFAVLYGITILLRHHKGEMAPFFNDMEARKLKRKIIKTTDSRLIDRAKNHNNKESTSFNIFNKKVRQERNKRKAIKIVMKTIRRSKVYITTTDSPKQSAPIKKYKVIFKNPQNTEASNKLFSKIKDLHNKLIQFTKVTFDQYKQPKDRSVYIFEGSIEKERVEARAIKKGKKAKEVDVNESQSENETRTEGNFPLDLLEDRSINIKEQEAKAQAFAEEKIKDIDQYFASSDVQADLDYYNVGKSSVAYYYKPRYAKINKSPREIQENLIRIIKNDGVLVTDDAGTYVINITLPELVDIDNRKTIAEAMANAKDKTHAVFGVATDNSIISKDISKAPHMIVAGSTGSGKSVGINYILTSMSYNSAPSDLELALLDPKQVEFAPYENHPCNIVKPVDNPEDAVEFLKYATYLMSDRFAMLKKEKVRNIDGYNKKMRKKNKPIMKQLVIVIDEYNDLVMVEKEVEYSVTRITQLGRAAGMHLILATQRPSVDVITGIIKNNMLTRLAYQVASSTDSRTTIDATGAENLNGKGDSLLKWNGSSKFIRMQGGFLEDHEVQNVVDYLNENFESNPIVDYKARVQREEGENEDDSEMYDAVTSYGETMQSFEQQSIQEEPVNNEPTNEDIIEDDNSKEEPKTKVVKLNAMDFIKKDNKGKRNETTAKEVSNKAEEPKNVSSQETPAPPKSKPNKTGNRRKTKEEMSEIDNLILNKAFENMEKRRKQRKK